MQVSEPEWNDTEQKIARNAFEKAYAREIEALIKKVREEASTLMKLGDLWQLHDFLSAKRHQVEGKYDYEYSALLFVFAGLVKEGWLHVSELEGLNKDKLAKITSLARM
jgi:Photoprotection regulator fluorescence recovery protein